MAESLPQNGSTDYSREDAGGGEEPKDHIVDPLVMMRRLLKMVLGEESRGSPVVREAEVES